MPRASRAGKCVSDYSICTSLSRGASLYNTAPVMISRARIVSAEPLCTFRGFLPRRTACLSPGVTAPQTARKAEGGEGGEGGG